MKALSLTQPWATLVAIGAKRIETRSWDTRYRGPLAIHAAKGFPKWARQFTAKPVCYEAVQARYFPRDLDKRASGFPAYPVGCVIATVRLVSCWPTSSVFTAFPHMDTERERAFGDYSADRYAWILDDISIFETPIPARGMLGLWNWSAPFTTSSTVGSSGIENPDACSFKHKGE